MPKILVLDGLSEEGVDVFRSTEGFEVDVKPSQKPDELSAIIPDYEGLVVRSATTVPAGVIEKADRLRVIGRAGVGTDNIDKDAATRKGVVVMNTPGGNTISAAEHTFALLLALCRNVPKADASMKAGQWDRKKFMGAELCGKTLGIVGAGRVGAALARRAQAFDMKVIVNDPILTQLKADALGVELVSFDALVERSDFITVHVPKSDKTKDMFRAEQFKRMKPTCRIINTARGGILNEADLAQALKNGDIAGAGLDVYTSEPFENNPFTELDNIVTTPHLAASTNEAQRSVAVDIAEQMVAYLTTGAIINAVNVPSLDSESLKVLKPILGLAEQLGRFQAHYAEGRPTAIEIQYFGDAGVADTYPITATVMAGYLAPMIETVNEVNALALLEEHGIRASETKHPEPSDYSFQIVVRVQTDTETHEVAGTLFGKTDARICSIDGIRVDAKPEGYMVVCENEDKPFIIGRVGTILGEAGVNIANMTLGRAEQGGRALTVLNVDQAIGEDLMKKIADVPHVLRARLVAF